MILTCPACATRYQIDEAKFPPGGRSVRCAKCGHVWHQDAPEAPPPDMPEASLQESVAPSSPEIEEARPVPRALRPLATPDSAATAKPRPPVLPLLGVALGWAGLIAVVLLIGFAAVRYRQEVTVIWPQTAGVYSSLGMDVNAHGIDFADVTYRRESEDGQVVLAVTGRIINKGGRELPVPQMIRVTLSDAAGHEIYHWNFAPGVQTLQADQSTPFRTRLSNPPATARHLEVRFVRDDK